MITNDKEQHLLQGLAANEKNAIETIYRENYGVIQSFILKNNGYSEDARDVFQEAMIVLYEKAKSDSFELNCQIKTYLYSVCRRLWLKRLQKLQRYNPAIESIEETIPVEEELEAHEKKNEDFNLMELAMDKIGEPCKSLLEAYYFQKKTMPEIADFFGYTNADNAKTQKYKCLVRLKKIFLHNIKTENMDDILLLDAIERYKKGEMTAQEKTFFEELRKNNPEIDQLVVEHMFFLQELENTANTKAYKQSLNEVENKLINDGVIAKKQLKGKAKVIYMWNRYSRTIAVAASIAGIVSIFTAGLFSEYDKNKSAKVITPLVDYKFKQVDAKLKQFEKKLNQAAVTAATPVDPKPKFEANFRATGFLIDVTGYIVTNAHVINNAKNLIVEDKKGDQFYAKVVYVSNENDLAILKINDTSFKKYTVLPYSIRRLSAELGEHIFTLGYPRDEVVYGEGYLSAKSGFSGDTSSYQISISVNPGNSGGPVINKNGEIIGIISSKETNADGVVFAIKSKNIYNALDEIKKDETIKLPLTGTIKGLDRVQQIKKIEDCVFMVKGN